MFCIGDAANPDLTFLIFSSNVPSLIYYSHIPAIFVSLFLGLFVFFKKRDLLISKVLLSLSIMSSVLAMLDLIIWTQSDSRIVVFLWALWFLVFELVFILGLYFAYVFFDKKDISIKTKIVLGLLLLPTFFIVPTSYNLSGIDLSTCNAFENLYFSNFIYLISAFFVLWMVILSFLRYRKAEEEFKKQILFVSIGSFIFLSILSITSYFGSVEYFSNNSIHSFDIEQYGFFGMPIFIGFLAYIIVKYKAFNIKLIGAQALVVALVILIGSQFFFIQTDTNRILTAITLALAGGFGIFLIRSIKAEAQRKEELQLMSDKLAQSNDKLQKLDNAKSEFISIASHQLRTPLTAIKGFISLLNEGAYGNLDSKQSDVLKKVYISNERLIALVEDLLNISRIESGRMEFKFDSCQLTDLCSELVDTFTFKAKDANLYLDFKAPENALPEVFVDRAKVREVLSNLIDNAIKYTPKGGVSVRLERIFAEDSKIENVNERGSVKIIISDTGIGVPAEEIPYLFSKFSRGKDVSRLNVSGTGLGLYVGRSMIEANGGKIWLESEGAGKGSRFIIEVPVEQTPENLTRWS